MTVADGFTPDRVRHAHFAGTVQIGSQTGTVGAAVSKCAGLFNAWIANCTIGSDVRIANIGSHLANYHIGDHVTIENVGRMEANAGATFGNGVKINVLNESGGREIVLFNQLNAQFAYLMCMHRYRSRLIDRLNAIAQAEADAVRSDRGTVGEGACVRGVTTIEDVNIGPHAIIEGANALINGTILSNEASPTTVGTAVQAEHFIVAEGSEVAGGAIVSSSFIGQNCRVGRQFSMTDSLMFAHSTALHGEACSWFGGPYSVTRHKSTLLIAMATSFFNAGSGTNASNHMYKLGPMHEGKLQRGVKTGSNSTMMWPSRVGPFSIVIGRHISKFDASAFPFSLVRATSDGRCNLVPGLMLTKVGTARDELKWQTHEARHSAAFRDHVSADVFNPYTVGCMIRARQVLQSLERTIPPTSEAATVDGAEIRRASLQDGIRFYSAGIEIYLLDEVVSRLEKGIADAKSITDSLPASDDTVSSDTWVDIGGQLMPQARMDELVALIETGEVADVMTFFSELDRIAHARADDEWAWARHAYASHFDQDLGTIRDEHISEIAQRFLAVRSAFVATVLADAAREFSQRAQLGYGQDGDPDDAAADFEAVHGTYEQNACVRQLQDSLSQLEQRIEKLAGETVSSVG